MGLFVIKQRGKNLYWAHTEGGSGWVPSDQKQAWSQSELAKHMGNVIRAGFWDSFEIFWINA